MIHHFHTHPQGRLREILFWEALGLGLAALAYFPWRAGALTTPLALMLGIVALCFIGWGFLPHNKPKQAPPPPTGRLRAEKAAAVKASKEEGRRAKAAKRGER